MESFFNRSSSFDDAHFDKWFKRDITNTLETLLYEPQNKKQCTHDTRRKLVRIYLGYSMQTGTMSHEGAFEKGKKMLPSLLSSSLATSQSSM